MSGFRLDRRSLLVGSGALLVAARAPGAVSSAAWDSEIVLRLSQGRIRGRKEDGTVAFKAIPFAAPPTGTNRFRPPQPVSSWDGIRDGTAFGPAPIQADPMFGGSAAAYLNTPERSEDCLYLNVFAPDTPGPHPVYVWVHGGANESGAASQAPFDTGSFVREGIVCVTVGYRVGMFGFLELGGLLGPAWRGSGNNGLRDILAGLEWVRRNIRLFGGDPGRVTIGGESAGAKNVVSLMATPSARGLFQRAIVQSGSETVHDLATADAVGALTATLLAKAGRPVRSLLSMEPAAVLEVQANLKAAFDRPFPFRAVVGGDLIPRRPLAALRAGAAAQVGLLIGTNRDEAVLFLDRGNVGQPLARSELSDLDVPQAAVVFERYRQSYPQLSPTALRIRFLTAEGYWRSTIALARAHASHRRAPTYVYRFDSEARSGPFAGWASHAAELGYTWDRLGTPMARSFGQSPTGADQRLADDMHARWAGFITDGRPRAPGRPAWPAFGADETGIVFGGGASPRPAIDAEELALWGRT